MALADNFFRDPASSINDFFDEGPVVVRSPENSTGSIDTSAIDKFRQGVELTQLKHFDAGSMAKIHAGDPGHILRQTTYGDRNIFDRRTKYVDRGDLSPSELITANIVKTNRTLITAPFTANPADNESSTFYDRFLFDGIVDPLGINSRSERLAVDQPLDPKGEKGALQSGNENREGVSDVVVTVFKLFSFGSAFDDTLKSTVAWPLVGRNPPTALSAFYVDEQSIIANVVSESVAREALMTNALAAMTSSTDNYVLVGFKSAPCGWDHENNELGTDSIAFGGLTY